MLKRRLGRTGHESSVAILGGVAFSDASPEDVTGWLGRATTAGVNHLDIAPSYGEAEARVGPHLPAFRARLYISEKTAARDRDGARAELEKSLELLRTDHFELYQFHAVTSEDDVDRILAPGGAAEALVQARDEGLITHLGITGHLEKAPRLFCQVLEALDLDTVMFPVNAPLWANRQYRADAERLLAICAERDLGVMAIKAIARGFWPTEEHNYQTWYQPLEDRDHIQRAVNFTLSLPIHGFPTVGDLRLLGAALDAAQQFTPLSQAEIDREIAENGLQALVGRIH
ncbi:MAG: aldo/keto reductase [Candidatus Dormibacteria bacterium]